MGSLQWSRGSGLPVLFAQGLAQGGFGAGITNANGNRAGTVILCPQILPAGARQQKQPCSATPAPFTFHISVEQPEQIKIQALDFLAVPKMFAAEGGEETGEEGEPEKIC